jgi:histidine ammonia-lyase
MPNPIECIRNITKYKPHVFANIEVTDNSVVFADDTSLYVIVDEQNYIQAADMLSTVLSHIHNWSQNWAIKFNPNKTESVLIKLNQFYLDENPSKTTFCFLSSK